MNSFFPSQLWIGAFGSDTSAGSWTSFDQYPRRIADVDNNGYADVVGFGEAGTYVSLSLETGFGVYLYPLILASSGFGASAASGGWSSDNQFPRRLGDINGDGRADIVGFGAEGTYFALANANGTFGAVTLATRAFALAETSGGWASNDRNPRMLADVNGDGRDDIVGFGNAGVYVSLSDGDGSFGAPILAGRDFGADAASGQWASNGVNPRVMADMNRDGRADIVGFGNAGVYVAFATAGGTFEGPLLASAEFGAFASSGGWWSNDLYPREIGYFDADDIPDIFGFGNDGVWIALGRADGTFAPATLELNEFGLLPEAGGWTSNSAMPRMIGDFDNSGRDDIFGFASDGVWLAPSTYSPWDY